MDLVEIKARGAGRPHDRCMNPAAPAPALAPLDPDPQHVAARALRAADRAFDRLYGAAANPLRQLGALVMFSFWLSVGSGTYLYI